MYNNNNGANQNGRSSQYSGGNNGYNSASAPSRAMTLPENYVDEAERIMQIITQNNNSITTSKIRRIYNLICEIYPVNPPTSTEFSPLLRPITHHLFPHLLKLRQTMVGTPYPHAIWGNHPYTIGIIAIPVLPFEMQTGLEIPFRRPAGKIGKGAYPFLFQCDSQIPEEISLGTFGKRIPDNLVIYWIGRTVKTAVLTDGQNKPFGSGLFQLIRHVISTKHT